MDPALKKLLEKITVLPHDEYLKQIEAGGILICSRVVDGALWMRDNDTGQCRGCGHPIQFRPYNKTAAHKLCFYCAAELFRLMKEGEPS